MTKKQLIGSVKRFGVRYGRRIKRKTAEVEESYKRKQKCPYCNANTAKRVSNGIWECKKCNSKFTAKAYSLSKTKIEEVKI